MNGQGELFGVSTMARDATFLGRHRLKLSRDWAEGRRALVIGCNPSAADAMRDDPTSRWWNRWFSHAGFGGYDAVNLYPFCTASPLECRKIASAISDDDQAALDRNLDLIVALARSADQIFACWGAIAWDRDWIAHVCNQIGVSAGSEMILWCWGQTKDGAPKHPLARGKHRIEPRVQPEIWLRLR